METPMPRDLTEEAVAEWAREVCCLNVQQIPAAELRAWEHSSGKEGWRIVAAHFLALVEAKVREGLAEYRRLLDTDCDYDDEIVARVMGKEAPRA